MGGDLRMMAIFIHKKIFQKISRLLEMLEHEKFQKLKGIETTPNYSKLSSFRMFGK